MSKKLMIFPYNYESQSVIDHVDLMTEYNLCFVASFNEDRDVGISLPDTIKYTVEFDSALYAVDCVAFCDNILNVSYDSYVRKINSVLRAGKPALIGSHLLKRIRENATIELFQNENLHILDNDEINAHSETDKIGARYDYVDIAYNAIARMRYQDGAKLHNIDKPIITVCGFGENCNKLDVQLELYSIFEKQGYSPLLICSNPLGALFSLNVMPSFIFDETMSMETKTVAFNNYLKGLVEIKNPDIIVLGMPGGIMPRNKLMLSHCSEAPLAIGNAVSTDIGIVCIDYTTILDSLYINELQHLCKYKLNMPIEAVILSSQRKRYRYDDKSIEVFYLSPDFISKNSQDSCANAIPVSYVADKKATREILDGLVHLLQGNADAI